LTNNENKLHIKDLENINLVRDPSFRVMADREMVCKYRNYYRQSDKKIGFVGGVYDMLHDGHIKYLLECLRRCDILIVALDDDELARKRKNDPLRPFDSEEKRAKRLSWCGFAHIITFRHVGEHPHDLIKFLEPDILFTSKSTADVTDEDRRILQEHCGEVVVFDPQSPDSTTSQMFRIEAVHTNNIVQKLIEVQNQMLKPFGKMAVIQDLEE
jgi:cytidyltransferase-like protein